MAKFPSVRFFGKPHPKSGYGNATMNISWAFSDSNVNTSFCFESDKAGLKKELKNYNGKTSIDFYIHTPPFGRHSSKNYKIGYFYWETSALPNSWAKDIKNNVDELWVPCELTKDACVKAGFKGPIEILHTPYGRDLTTKKVQIPSPIDNSIFLSEKTFKFYSVFQWNNRKGYKELLRAYFEEFDRNDDVVLILKVNPLRSNSQGFSRIRSDIIKMKTISKKKRLPMVYLITKHISKDELFGLHSLCDTFVLPHHGEGWGMPIHTAMLFDSNIITTKFGGITELLNDNNADLIRHEIGPVKGMSWNKLYNSSQLWANPKLSHLKELMRKSFNNKDNYSEKRALARDVAHSLSIKTCSSRIESILSKNRFKRLI